MKCLSCMFLLVVGVEVKSWGFNMMLLIKFVSVVMMISGVWFLRRLMKCLWLLCGWVMMFCLLRYCCMFDVRFLMVG